jgi:hypothetical protein
MRRITRRPKQIHAALSRRNGRTSSRKLARRAPLTLALADQNEMTIRNDGGTDRIEILSHGRATLTITVSPAGLSIELGALEVSLTSDGALKIAAEQLELVGRNGVALRSDSDLSLSAVGKLTTTADDQTLVARLGNVDIKANDDVSLVGERILLNS